MRLVLATILFVTLLQRPADSAELELVFRHGKAIKDREAAWPGHVNFASWVDDDLIVYGSGGAIRCLSTTTSKEQWAIPKINRIDDWSACRSLGRLVYVTEDNDVVILDATNGHVLFRADPHHLAKLLGVDLALPTRVALTPDDGRLLVCTFATAHGRNAFILDPTYKTLISSLDIDASPSEVSISPDGCRMAVLADDNVMCVTDLVRNRDIFFSGKRIKQKPDSIGGTIDVPFFSHLRDSGKDEIVYSQDNSWSTGRVFIHNLKSMKKKVFDAGNGHIELDVSFRHRRIALTGTSTDVTVMDFDGKRISQNKGATLQRNASIEFSPSGDKLVVGSWDNTVSVFRISGANAD